MLVAVKMTVRVPANFDKKVFSDLVKEEKERAQALQEAGTWVHLWRIAGEYANFSIFDVETTEQLHEILSTLPLFPFMKIKVTPLCKHPSAI